MNTLPPKARLLLALALLHLGLAARVVAGLTENFPLRQQAAVANALTLLLFLLLVVTSLRVSRQPARGSNGVDSNIPKETTQ